jgi:hypothetical protein
LQEPEMDVARYSWIGHLPTRGVAPCLELELWSGVMMDVVIVLNFWILAKGWQLRALPCVYRSMDYGPGAEQTVSPTVANLMAMRAE